MLRFNSIIKLLAKQACNISSRTVRNYSCLGVQGWGSRGSGAGAVLRQPLLLGGSSRTLPTPSSFISRLWINALGSVREMGCARKLKTKKGALKRFLVTGKGKLKRGHAGKGHLTSGKSKNRLRRLNTKVLLTGVWAKKMGKLIM